MKSSIDIVGQLCGLLTEVPKLTLNSTLTFEGFVLALLHQITFGYTVAVLI